MPIVTPELPPEAIEATLRALSATGRFPRRRDAELSLASPHPVYTVGLDRLAAGDRPLESADLVAWRALLEEDKEVVAAVELPGPAPGRAGAVVNRGAFVESTVAALNVAERQERVAAERHELRLLRVNALYLLALWLRAAEATADLFVPLSPAPPPLRPDTAYESAAFEEQLSELARSVASAYEGAERPDELGS